MRRGDLSQGSGCGRRFLPAVLTFALLACAPVSAVAQRIIFEPPRVYTPPVVTQLPHVTLTPSLVPTPSFHAPVAAPVVTPMAAPPVASPEPVTPTVRAVRFHCDVPDQQESCREHAETPDGGGDDGECDCARDTCYFVADQTTGLSRRVCEKSQ